MFGLLKRKVAESLSEATGEPLNECERTIELPKGEFGDVASSICFSLAKKRKKPPQEIASEVAATLRLPDWVAKVRSDGPYLNFTLSSRFYSKLIEFILKEGEKYGRGKKKKAKTIVEFPSVNPNKPWHVGHLRNALLGDSVARILEFSGEDVERMDYIDDLGLQVAQSFWGYLNLKEKPSGKLDLWLGKQYVEVAKKFEEDKKVQEEVRQLLLKMEEGKGQEAQKCRELVEKCVAAQYETAFKFKIYHDVLIFESDIVRTIFEEGMEKIRKSKAIVKEKSGKNAGCLVAKMESEEFASMESPDKILVRSDGTATYTGKDVIFQMWKFGLLKGDFRYATFMRQPNGKECEMSAPKGTRACHGKASRVINVIGMEQAYPQKVIREILRSMGYEKEAENSVHLAYEHVWLEDEKFSGRQGTWVGYTADELYEEGVKRAQEKIKSEVAAEERGRIAASVAAGAIRFSFLRTSPEKKITFKWDSALSLEGDSAPYVMYAHARAQKIFEKGGKGRAEEGAELEDAEKELLKKIMLFDWVVSEAARQLRPHLVADFCLELAEAYNKFYNSCPILSAGDERIQERRLAINYASLVALKNSLSLLGIDALKRM
ncbi:MAG: arginine--tRNA ligase [Candidatus Micrarchaeota archaeon]|nr:arginine--tRNA ligase [Candidatus Micrarchaeota archaeon]